MRNDVDVKSRLESTPFDDESFNLIICNHVLEHIPDDTAAMNEIYRLLKKCGTAILQVPVSIKLKETYENINIRTEEEKLKKYGQKDHERIYSKNAYINKLQESGLRVQLYNYTKYNPKLSEKYKLISNEDLFICKKL